ncbi:uncharacterized protein MELLADRAFT_76768 [Melampsora larici-populina 98AG31]|uniref:C3H1-type domain-containing protein n=1 Tax=Melampsora larici-populina (strain 98AG31 / pathotype 3-4-7) TaxID=747676 RepID=F4R9G4_MELLP|nr:uncharacterized protein MELLADRAFT_76768 [Melampsora larici-populina 98AG31]EGG11156.1 hypothetical protein MELLADRAFT_76768 [Melampsora larici-populina 98AG31]
MPVTVCDADPSVLSDYVTALLRHDQPISQLKSSCLKQLEDFLHQVDLFEHLQAFDVNGKYTPPDLTKLSSGLLGKRSYSMENLSPVENHSDDNNQDQANTSLPIPQYTPTQSHPSFLLYPNDNSQPSPPSLPPFNASNHSTQTRFGSSPPKNIRSVKRARKTEICRDYHYRGFCARGEGCQFSHDEREANPSPVSQLPAPVFPNQTRGETEASASSQGSSRSNIIPPLTTQPFIPGLPTSLPFTSDVVTTLFPVNSLTTNNAPNQYSAQPYRSDNFNQNPLRPNKSKTTLVVENIPQSSLSDRYVRDYFSTFGSLVSVSVDVYNAQALVTFQSAEDAAKAYASPEPVFNNRFVKIHFRRFNSSDHFRRDQGSNSDQSPRQNVNMIPLPQTITPGNYSRPTSLLNPNPNKYHQTSSYRQNHSTEPSLYQKEQELREKIEEQKKLMEQLSLKQALKRVTSAVPATTSGTQSQPETKETTPQYSEPNGGTNPVSEAGSQTNRTKSSAGLDTDLEDRVNGRGSSENPERGSVPPLNDLSGTSAPNRGGIVRGRGGLSSTRGGFSGRGAWSNLNKAFRLDNRTCTLSVRDVPNFEAQEKIRKHLEQFGTIVAVAKMEENEEEGKDDFTIKFSTRASAEKALAHGKDVPEVGKIKMNWINQPMNQSNQENGFIPGLTTHWSKNGNGNGNGHHDPFVGGDDENGDGDGDGDEDGDGWKR